MKGFIMTEMTKIERNMAGVQTIAEGDQIVTVARDGARCTPHGWPIYVTAVYIAKARASDGVLTWRRQSSVGYATSGKRVTAPMERRAREYAASKGLPYLDSVRQGQACFGIE